MELDAIRLRLLRRSQIIEVIRKAYIRDVVVLKNELMRKSATTEEVRARYQKFKIHTLSGPSGGRRP